MGLVPDLFPTESDDRPTESLEPSIPLLVVVLVGFVGVYRVAIDLDVQHVVDVGEIRSGDHAALVPDLVVDLGHWKAYSIEERQSIDLRWAANFLITRVSIADQLPGLSDAIPSLSCDLLHEVGELRKRRESKPESLIEGQPSSLLRNEGDQVKQGLFDRSG